jgi:hypothetical protein
MNLRRPIAAYEREGRGEHHRYRSWEHCYAYFRQARRRGLARERDQAALQLGFYLASWGMYRGSSFLLQYSYTVHRTVVDLTADRHYDKLWNTDFGANEADSELVPDVERLIEAIRQSYRTFVPSKQSRQPTDTLITKAILGTFGCLPACDRYFLAGFKRQGFKSSRVDAKFIERVLRFCQEHLEQLRQEQIRIERRGGVRYPLMKLVDMCFWQIGYENAR